MTGSSRSASRTLPGGSEAALVARQPVPIGGHQLEAGGTDLDTHTAQGVARLVLRDRIGDLVDERGGQRDGCQPALAVG